MENGQFLTAFQANFDRANNFFSNSYDRQLLLSLACKTTLANKVFSGVALEATIQQIEAVESENLSFLHNAPISYKLALYLQDEGDLHNAITKLIKNDKVLGEENFKSNYYPIIASLLLEEDSSQHAKRARRLFDEMNRLHPLLTSKEDIPYAVLLTKQENDFVQQAESMVKYYKELRNHQFQLGNSLQALTQIMTLYGVQYNDMLCQYIVELRDELVKNGVKVKKYHYPFLGILALAATDEYKIDEIVTLHRELSTLKAFRQSKDYILVVAIQKAVRDLIELQSVVDLAKISQLDTLLVVADSALEFTSIFSNGVLSIFNGDLFS